ncbi:hypothetical protein V500_07462 [Pseudogymnoascus sp. VKM F-4518 (FW-2643)]|nr:hypothetical protein V500_07462 [Pseudogymnoascus sp. VKM F-4518 (FW-2643)]
MSDLDSKTTAAAGSIDSTSDAESNKMSVAAPAAPPAPAIQPPPNGGLKAWLQVLGAFLIVLNTWGLANSFGVFQTYYSTTLLVTSSPSSISWIGSIQGFLLLFIGVFCGRAFGAGYLYPVASLGIFLEIFGMMMTSFSTKYYQVFLAQELCVGLGSGCLFTPAISLVGQYFSTKRGLATGIAAAGSSVGGIIFPVVISRLIDSVGFPWAMRVMAFIMLATLGLGIALLRAQFVEPKREAEAWWVDGGVESGARGEPTNQSIVHNTDDEVLIQTLNTRTFIQPSHHHHTITQPHHYATLDAGVSKCLKLPTY